MDEQPIDEIDDDEPEAPPPIGLPSRELAIMLAEALRDMRDRDEEMDDETILVLIAAAIEANNRQLYADLVEAGVLTEESDDDDSDENAS